MELRLVGLLMSLLAMAALLLQECIIPTAAKEEEDAGVISKEENLMNSSRRREAQYVGGAGRTLGRDDYFAFRVERDAQRRRSLHAARERHRHHPYRAPATNASQLTDPDLMDVGGLSPEASPEGQTWTLPLTTDSFGQTTVTLQIGGSADVLPLNQTVVLDTGSSVTWVQCEPWNVQQHPQKDPLYDVRNGATFKYIECTDKNLCTHLLREQDRHCEDATNECVFGKRYADQSTVWGFWGLDTIRLGSWKAEDVPIGCAYSSHLVYVQDVAGILGFGQGSESIVSTKGSSFGNSFAYCLPIKNSKVVVEGYLKLGLSAENPQRRWIKMLKSPVYQSPYFVALVGIRVDHQDLPINPAHFSINPFKDDQVTGAFLDSGTTVTYFPSHIYTTLIAALRGSMAKSGYSHVAGTFGGLLKTCYKLPSQDLKLVEGLPVLEFVFAGGASWPLDRYNFLKYLDEEDLHCFIFVGERPEEEGLHDVTVIGDVQMQGIEWTFDLANNKIGFLTGAC